MDNLQEEVNEESESKSENFYSSRKKLVWLLIIVVLFVIIGLAVTKKDNKNNYDNNANIVFDNNAESIMLGSSKRITASIINNPIYEVRYQSSDESVINVDKSGLVESVGLGSATLKAYYFDANGKEHFVERRITVYEGNSKINVTGVKFPDGDLVIKLYGEYNLGNKLIVSPSSGYMHSKVFRSSNEEVVSVSSNGQLIAVGEGEAIVNVRVNNQFDSNMRVYVTNEQIAAEIVKLPESINFDTNLVKLIVGETKNISYTLKPFDATDRFLTWVSSDQTVATVTNGIISAIGKGTCDITLRSINGKSAKLFVEVTEKIDVEKIKFNESSIVLKENDTYKLTPVVEPKTALDKKLSFSSDNKSVAIIEQSDTSSATIKAVGEGKANIIVKSNNGITASIRVSVTGKDAKDVSSSEGGVTVRINNNIVPAKEYSSDIKYTNPASITISKSGDTQTVRYCYAPYSNSICTPNLVYYSAFSIPSGDLYLLRVQKFDGNGKEIIGSNNDNYRNGALEYFINTQSNDFYKDIGYKIEGTYYSTILEANNNSVTKDVKLTFKFINTVTDKLKVCYTTGVSCDPDRVADEILTKNGLKSFTITEDGLWKIFVSEYSNDNKVGTTQKYYVKIAKSDTGYIIDGDYYLDEVEANKNPVDKYHKLTFNIVDSKTSKLKLCYNQDGVCSPSTIQNKIISANTISNYITLPRSGLWYITVYEYSGDDKISEKIYYVTVK